MTNSSESPPERSTPGAIPSPGGFADFDSADKVFFALAHPSRREMLVLLRDGPSTAGQIAEQFDAAWPTVSRHLGILEIAGLVRTERRGRERVYTLERGRLVELLGDWVDGFRS